MQIQQLLRTDPERILLLVKNVDGSGSITTGFGAALVATAASGDGVNAFRSSKTAGATSHFCGVALQDIAINAYGLVTAWGYAASVAISQSVGSTTITAGDVLIAATPAGTFTSVVTNAALSIAMYKYVIATGALADTISNPNPYIAGIVRMV